MKKPNILVLSRAGNIGGAEMAAKEYILGNSRFNYFILTNDKPYFREFFGSFAGSENCFFKTELSVISKRENPLKYILSIIIGVSTTAKIIREHHIDLIYGNGLHAVVLMLLYKLFYRSRIKAVLHVHDIVASASMITFAIKHFAHYMDRVIVPSNAARKALVKTVGVDSLPVKVVYNGFIQENSSNEGSLKTDFRCEYSIPLDKKVIAFVGTIIPQKGPDLFLEIVKRICLKRSDFMAVMAGEPMDGALYGQIQEQIRDQKLPVLLIGRLPHEGVMRLMQSTDLLVLTSNMESFSIVVLEAMQAGKIVVARGVGGVAEIVENSCNGFCFMPDESLDKVVDLVNYALDLDESTKSRISNNAKNTVLKRFDSKRKQKIINSLFDQLLRERK
jgi:glycosyltransferase involved in cell wall biosynthesis